MRLIGTRGCVSGLRVIRLHWFLLSGVGGGLVDYHGLVAWHHGRIGGDHVAMVVGVVFLFLMLAIAEGQTADFHWDLCTSAHILLFLLLEEGVPSLWLGTLLDALQDCGSFVVAILAPLLPHLLKRAEHRQDLDEVTAPLEAERVVLSNLRVRAFFLVDFGEN